MPQSFAAEATTKLGQTAQNFLAALKSGFQPGVDGNLFASLLSEAKAAPPEPRLPTRQPELDDRPARATQRDVVTTTAEGDESDEALQEIRAMIQQLREKLAELRARQQGKQDSMTADTAPVTDKDAAGYQPKQDLASALAAMTDGLKEAIEGLSALVDQATEGQKDQSSLVAMTAVAKPDQVAGEQAIPMVAEINQLDSLTQRLEQMLQKLQQKMAQIEDAQQKQALAKAAQQLLGGLGATELKLVEQPQKLAEKIETGVVQKTGADPIAAANASMLQAATQPTYQEQKQAVTTKQLQIKEADLAQAQQEARSTAQPATNPAPTTVLPMMTGQMAGRDSGDAMAKSSSNHAAANLQPVAVEGLKGANSSYDFAGQLSATRLTKGGTAGLPQVVEQVTLQINRQAKEGLDQMTIQLRPAELGRVEIRLEFGADQRVQGKVIVDNPATLDLLQKDARGIERALQDAGLRADAGSLEFSLRGDGQTGATLQQERQNNRNHSNSQLFVLDQAAANSNASDDMLDSYFVAPGRINMKV